MLWTENWKRTQTFFLRDCNFCLFSVSETAGFFFHKCNFKVFCPGSMYPSNNNIGVSGHFVPPTTEGGFLWNHKCGRIGLQKVICRLLSGWLYKLVISPCNIQIHTGLSWKDIFQALSYCCIFKLSPTQLLSLSNLKLPTELNPNVIIVSSK